MEVGRWSEGERRRSFRREWYGRVGTLHFPWPLSLTCPSVQHTGLQPKLSGIVSEMPIASLSGTVGTVRNAMPAQQATVSRSTATRPLPNPNKVGSLSTSFSGQPINHIPSVNGRALPTLPSSTSVPVQQASKPLDPPNQTVRNTKPQASPPEHHEEGEDDVMLGGVIFPAISNVGTTLEGFS